MWSSLSLSHLTFIKLLRPLFWWRLSIWGKPSQQSFKCRQCLFFLSSPCRVPRHMHGTVWCCPVCICCLFSATLCSVLHLWPFLWTWPFIDSPLCQVHLLAHQWNSLCLVLLLSFLALPPGSLLLLHLKFIYVFSPFPLNALVYLSWLSKWPFQTMESHPGFLLLPLPSLDHVSPNFRLHAGNICMEAWQRMG